jgi:hypothetical protein
MSEEDVHIDLSVTILLAHREHLSEKEDSIEETKLRKGMGEKYLLASADPF